jgi:hypothetical protein
MELADVPDSKSGARKGVPVRPRPPANTIDEKNPPDSTAGFIFSDRTRNAHQRRSRVYHEL